MQYNVYKKYSPHINFHILLYFTTLNLSGCDHGLLLTLISRRNKCLQIDLHTLNQNLKSSQLIKTIFSFKKLFWQHYRELMFIFVRLDTFAELNEDCEWVWLCSFEDIPVYSCGFIFSSLTWWKINLLAVLSFKSFRDLK